MIHSEFPIPEQRADETLGTGRPADAAAPEVTGTVPEVSLESAQLVMGAIHMMTTRPEVPLAGPELDS